LSLQTVSHGRVLFDTHNEFRFAVARCLVEVVQIDVAWLKRAN
jgi:hypothetical protein